MPETRTKLKIRKGDTVVVIAGKDKGKSGKVLSVIEKTPSVVVEKLNIMKRHTKHSQQNRQGFPSPLLRPPRAVKLKRFGSLPEAREVSTMQRVDRLLAAAR